MNIESINSGGSKDSLLSFQGKVQKILRQIHRQMARTNCRTCTTFLACFAVSGLSLVITTYLTALHLPAQSSIIALSRSLVLPVILLLTLFDAFPGLSVILAIPVAEMMTFILAVIFLARFFPIHSTLQGNLPFSEVQSFIYRFNTTLADIPALGFVHQPNVLERLMFRSSSPPHIFHCS